MTTHKTLDIDTEINAMQEKVNKRKIDHHLKIAEIVVESGIHKVVDGDELLKLLVRERDLILAAKPPSQEHGAANGTFPEKPATPRKKKHADPEPGGVGAPDLLASTEEE